MYRGCIPNDEQNWLDLLDLLSETQLESLDITDLVPTSLNAAQRPLKTVKTLSLDTHERLMKHGVTYSPSLSKFPTYSHFYLQTPVELVKSCLLPRAFPQPRTFTLHRKVVRPVLARR